MPIPKNKLLWGQNQISNGLSCRGTVCLNLNAIQERCLNLKSKTKYENKLYVCILKLSKFMWEKWEGQF